MPPVTDSTILDALPLGIVLFDLDGRVVRANPQASALLGYNAERDASKTVAELLGELEGVGDARNVVKRAVTMGGPARTMLSRAPVGLPGELRITVQRVELAGAPHGLLVLDTISGDAAVVEGLRVALADVADARHEINNHLMGIIGNLELVLSETDLGPTTRERIRAIEVETTRIRRRIKGLGRAGARPSSGD